MLQDNNRIHQEPVMEETISKIVEEWFLTEPLLFSAWCTHTLAENTRMNVPMRTGKMRIEYNPDMMKDWGRRQIEERLRFEVIRILLGHPYQRQPYKAKKATLGIASDMTLTSSYHNISTISLRNHQSRPIRNPRYREYPPCQTSSPQALYPGKATRTWHFHYFLP